MKKISLMVIGAILGIASASAQFEQGGKTLSGRLNNLDFKSSSYDGKNVSTEFGLGVNGSYFVIDNLAVTAGVGIDYNKPEVGEDRTDLTFTVGARYYFWAALYGGVAYKGIQEGKDDLGSYVNVEVGYDLYITENVFIEPAVYYLKGLAPEGNKNAQFGLSVGIGVNF